MKWNNRNKLQILKKYLIKNEIFEYYLFLDEGNHLIFLLKKVVFQLGK